MFLRHLICGLFAVLLCASPVFAQEDADRLEKRFDEPKLPKSTPDRLMPIIKDAIPPEEADQIRFVLKALEVEGNTVYSDDEISLLYQDLIGREISLSDIYGVVNAITAKYGQDGYMLSRAYVPAQSIEDGVVHLGILEGYIDEVIFEGSWGNKRELFEEYARNITSERPITSQVLERYLLLANDLAGIKVKSDLKKSENNPGATTLILIITEKKLSGFLSIDNRGTDANGPVQVTPGFTISNPFGYFSDTSFLYATTTDTDELKYFSVNHKHTLNSEGTSLGISGTYSKADPGTELLQSIEQNSKSKSASIFISHPVIRSRQKNLSFGGRFEARDSESFTLGQKASEDKLRVLRLNTNFDYADSYGGVNQAIFEYSHGFKGMGATDNNSTLKTRSDGVVDFDKITIYLSRTQDLKAISGSLASWQIHTALSGQYSKDALLSSEECGVGGKQFGRAYDSSELTGEHCFALSLEARHLLYVKEIDSKTKEYIQVYGFWDVGEVRNKNPSASVPKSESLASAGVGLRFSFAKNISGSIELAKPLTREVANEGNKDLRAFASLVVSF